MPLPSSNVTPERKAELERLLLTLDQPDPRTMSSLNRLLRVNLYREMMQAGIDVPEAHLSYGYTLITVDRADRTAAAAAERKAAKRAGGTSNGSTGPEPTAEDL